MRESITRGAWALAAVAGLAVVVLDGTRPAYGDMVLTADEGWWPKSEPPVPASERPSDEQLIQSEAKKVDAAYDVVKAQGFNKPAGLVLDVVSSAQAQNEDFKRARVDAESGAFVDAAEEFGAAAAALTGFAKQDALAMRVRAYWEAGAVDKMLPAIDELLAAFPKTFFLCEVQILRAKAAAIKNDTDGAAKALAAVTGAAGMNPRDALKARLALAFLTLEVKGKHQEARDAYQKIADDAGRVDPNMGEVTKLKALVGLGNCLLALKDAKKAGETFKQATSSKDPDVLAGAYAGLGDVEFAAARELREAGKLKEAKDLLDAAALDYLRVTIHYRERDNVEAGTVIRAQGNLSRALHALFDMTQGKDVDALDKALREYWILVKMPGFSEGPERTKAVAAIKELQEKRKALLEPAKDKEKESDKEKPPAMGG